MKHFYVDLIVVTKMCVEFVPCNDEVLQNVLKDICLKFY